MRKDIIRQWVNLLAFGATFALNGLANALPLNGQSTGEISDRFQVYFVPAGYVFSIWGLIYLGLGAFAVYQALPAQREAPRLRRIGYLFALSCLANIAWLFLWHYEQFPLTLVAMLSLLAIADRHLSAPRNRPRPAFPPSRSGWCASRSASTWAGSRSQPSPT